MNYYHLVSNDKSRTSWVLFDLVKLGQKHRPSPELPPVMYKLFGPQPDGEMSLKPRYAPLCCKACGRYDDDPVFEAGFEAPVVVRIKGDFGHTNDRVFLINDKFLTALRKARVQGYETKPAGTNGWHAMRITTRVNFSNNVIKLVKPICKE